jgi:hypothetical protein
MRTVLASGLGILIAAAGYLHLDAATPSGTPKSASPRSGIAMAQAVGSTTAEAPTRSTPRPVLDRYCVTCHNQRVKTAGLALDRLDVADVGAAPEIWEKVVRKLRSGAMPPAGA